jgi:hypothetical protein
MSTIGDRSSSRRARMSHSATANCWTAASGEGSSTMRPSMGNRRVHPYPLIGMSGSRAVHSAATFGSERIAADPGIKIGWMLGRLQFRRPP